MSFIGQSATYPYPQIAIDGMKVRALVRSQMSDGWTYGLGAKIEPVSLQSHEVPEEKREVDCSGEFRWLIWHATGGEILTPDGSANQHDWLRQQGFKPSYLSALESEDGVMRVVVLPQEKSRSHVGHIALVWNGLTYESHGSHGPDIRAVKDCPWTQLCDIYVLRLAR